MNQKVLLDTNIIIHRENKKATNRSIGNLYRWLDILKYDKLIHPYSIKEIEKYKDAEVQDVYKIKLQAYEVIQCVISPTPEFLQKINDKVYNENDNVDNHLLFEVYKGRVDILITEDRKLLEKARQVNLKEQVFSIDDFIEKATNENPSLIEYSALSVKKTVFGNIDINDSFFNSLKESYPYFDKWFARKANEEAYICKSNQDELLGFLYIKTEDKNENYYDIQPPFAPKRRLKVGTFKIESTGFRLGERFIKIIFDNAQLRDVDEIYVTLFDGCNELNALEQLFKRWGFVDYGFKGLNDKKEKVLVKKMFFDESLSVEKNFPNIHYSVNKFFLPIFPQYHTSLFPDSKLKTEHKEDVVDQMAHRYALRKVYISWADSKNVQAGDLVLIYRSGDEKTRKKYTSVVTTVCVVESIKTDIKNEEELLTECKNRSVFSVEELKEFWKKNSSRLIIVNLIFVISLTKRLNLDYLWENNVIPEGKGPRPFTSLTNEQFDMILKDSQTEIRFDNK